MAEGFSYAREGDVGTLTLAAGPMNLFSRAVVESLTEQLDAIEADRPRALVLRAEGQVFSAGVDVATFSGLSSEQATEFCRELIAITHRVEALPFPTIACVHALCLTAGFELSLACDMIWSTSDARFGLVERVVGVTPFMGGTQRVAERAGPANAREMVMTGHLYNAGQLREWGVVSTVFDDPFVERTTKVARLVAAGPPLAHAATKEVVRAVRAGGVREADERTCEIVAPLFDTEDLKAAVQTFLDQGPGNATFEGR